jgi:hemolysin D
MPASRPTARASRRKCANSPRRDAKKCSAKWRAEPKGQELVYAARVSLNKTQMQVDGKLVNLTPGMAVTVEIKTGSRRVIDYLLSPLFNYKHDALKER